MTKPNGHEISHGRGCHVARPMLAADVARHVLTWIWWRGSLTQRHVSRCGLSTCRALNGPRDALRFVHMSRCGLSTCRALNGPRVALRFVHVSHSGLSTCRALVAPRFALWLVHMAGPRATTCQPAVAPRGRFCWRHLFIFWLGHAFDSGCDTWLLLNAPRVSFQFHCQYTYNSQETGISTYITYSYDTMHITDVTNMFWTRKTTMFTDDTTMFTDDTYD
jgi:hypothetical protein